MFFSLSPLVCMTEWRRSWLVLDLENILLINLGINSWLRILILLSLSEEKQKIGICLLYKGLNMSSNSGGRILFSSLWENCYLEAVLQLCLNRNKPLLIQELKQELEHFMAVESVYYFNPCLASAGSHYVNQMQTPRLGPQSLLCIS